MKIIWSIAVEAGADSVKSAMGFVERQMSFQRLNAVQKALQELFSKIHPSPSTVYHLIHSYNLQQPLIYLASIIFSLTSWGVRNSRCKIEMDLTLDSLCLLSTPLAHNNVLHKSRPWRCYSWYECQRFIWKAWDAPMSGLWVSSVDCWVHMLVIHILS